jgi:tetratricopeptide (TPR) repeat protein
LTAADPDNPILRNWLYIALVEKCVLERDDPKTGVSTCREALQMAEDLVATDARSTLHVRNRASARITLAEALRLAGRHAEAMEQAAQASKELQSRLTDRESRAARLLCTLLLANILFDRAEFQNAAAHYDQARAVAESMSAADGTDMRMAAFVATFYEGLAACALKSKDRGKAAQWYQKSVAIWESWPQKGVTGRYDQSHLRNAQQRLKECLR